MFYKLIADGLVVLHLAFITFVVLGGFLLFKWRWLVFIHIPAFIWGALIEFYHWGCPLTPLENSLRVLAGDEGYQGGFIEHYLIPIIYPSGLTPMLQIALGMFVLAINLVIYGFLIWKLKKNNNNNRL